MQRLIAFALLVFLAPIFLFLYLAIKATSKGSFLFSQKRAGKNKKPFVIYKIRTMYDGAENDQDKYKSLNEADGPVFKIRNDPRYFPLGKYLSKTGLDELPQLINIVKGEMAFVGPRPLPIHEAQNVPKEFMSRFSILPGMTSAWVVKGAHKLTFEEWMLLDVESVKKRSKLNDVYIAARTLLVIFEGLRGR